MFTTPFSLARRSLFALPLLLVTKSAAAFPVAVEVISTVVRGQSPKLILRGVESAKNVVVSLKREDGKNFSFRVEQLMVDQTREIALDPALGRHTYEGAMTADIEGEKVSSPLRFKTIVAAPLTLSVDRQHLDLQKRSLQFSASAKLARADLKIFGPSGEELISQSFDLPDSNPKKPITLRWQGTSPDEIVRLELRITDQDGFFKGIALTPWSVHIPHEEVLFSSNSSDIRVSELGKLEASLDELEKVLERFQQVRGVQLFIAGHTDTKGKPAHNAHLSRLRAHAIAQWFVEQGVPTPVYFEGFGESSPKIKTGDEVDEPKNRRVDYILSVEPPPLRSRAHGWKRLK